MEPHLFEGPVSHQDNVFQDSDEIKTIIYPEDNSSKILSYKGTMSEGKPSGRGTMVWRNGAKYVGNWLKGVRDGQGVQFYASDSSTEKYDGGWQQSKYHGHGTLLCRDGSKYVGQFKDDKFDGQGVYTFKRNSGTSAIKLIFAATDEFDLYFGEEF